MTPFRVLVVEDELPLCRLIESVLRNEGYSVETAHDGAEAIRAIDGSHPDLVLLDLQLPVLDGYAVADHIKSHEANVPIVLMSGVPSAEKAAERIGVDEFLPKPFDVDDIVGVTAAFFLGL